MSRTSRPHHLQNNNSHRSSSCSTPSSPKRSLVVKSFEEKKEEHPSCPTTPSQSPDAEPSSHLGMTKYSSSTSVPLLGKALSSSSAAATSPDDTKATAATTVVTSTTTMASLQHHLLMPTHQHEYTALSDMLPCAALSPDDGDDDPSEHDQTFHHHHHRHHHDRSHHHHEEESFLFSQSASAVFTLPVPLPEHYNPLSSLAPGMNYYRVVYRGVVALLRNPRQDSSRSGVYLSFGEVFVAETVVAVSSSVSDTNNTIHPPSKDPCHSDEEKNHRPPTTSLSPRRRQIMPTGGGGILVPPPPPPPPCMPLLPNQGEKKHRLAERNTGMIEHADRDNKVLRVLHVLTGGYANEQQQNPTSLLEQQRSWGYLFVNSNSVSSSLSSEPIVERLEGPPPSVSVAQDGPWTYQIVSSSPIPIVTGPSDQAPRTAAMLLPGTYHEVSLVVGDYLRLQHRRGWICALQATTPTGLLPAGNDVPERLPAAQRVDADASHDDSLLLLPQPTEPSDSADTSVSSYATGGSSAYTTLTHHRRRPPRRHRPPRRTMQPRDVVDAPLPRHVLGEGGVAGVGTGVVAAHIKMSGMTTSPGSKHLDEKCSVSMVSDDDENDEDVGGVSSEQSSSQQPEDEGSIYLMRVWNPHGLKILDAPQFAVSHLIHGGNNSNAVAGAAGSGSDHSQRAFSTFPHMRTNSTVVFDSHSKTRKLPAGAFFEARTLLQPSLYQGEGLIQLLDKTGWAVVPTPTDVETVAQTGGVGVGTNGSIATATYEWIRVMVRSGVTVVCPPPCAPWSAPSGTNSAPQSPNSIRTGTESDVASSVSSALLDVFRTPKKKPPPKPTHPRAMVLPPEATTVPCGTIVQVERPIYGDYARLRGGQGWIAVSVQGKAVCQLLTTAPEYRLGSFWFRVQSPRGIKVRLGPSRRAPSIKAAPNGPSNKDVKGDVYFRFECGEFLRASEIVTILPPASNDPENAVAAECFCKLYRNRHTPLHQRSRDYRPLEAYTMSAEWVQVYHGEELYLEECAQEPRIERHRQGWKYQVLHEVNVRRGPSFAAENIGILEEGDTVVITERVSPAGDKLQWLRLKDGKGWVHDANQETTESLLVPYSQRHTAKKAKDDIAYNTIIARLFHNEDLHHGGNKASFGGKLSR